MTSQRVAQKYLACQINGASPFRLLVMTIEAALSGCESRDCAKTTRALSVLRRSLDYRPHPETAVLFFKLYQHCSALIRTGDFDGAGEILDTLRRSWLQTRTGTVVHGE